MASSTDKSDLVEIYFAYHLNGQRWDHLDDAKTVVEIKEKKFLQDEINTEKNRALQLADHVVNWLMKKGYGPVVSARWTGRSGMLQKILRASNVKSNPTDVLLEFRQKRFLGVSLKTAQTSKITYKNVNLSSVDKKLKLNLVQEYKNRKVKIEKELELPSSSNSRRKFLIENPLADVSVKASTENFFEFVRDKVLEKYKAIPTEILRKDLPDLWLDSSPTIFPPYVIAISQGFDFPFTTSIINPIKDQKIALLLDAERITFLKLGYAGFGVIAKNAKIFKIRCKFESEAWASQFKLLSESWV